MASEMNYEPFDYLGLTKKITEAITKAIGKEPEIIQDAIDAIDLMPEDEPGSFKYKNYRALIRSACKQIGADVPRKKYKRIEDELEKEIEPVIEPEKECQEEEKTEEMQSPYVIQKTVPYKEIASNNKLYDICEKLLSLKQEVFKYEKLLDEAKKEFIECRETLNEILQVQEL